MLEESASAIPSSIWASLNSWFTPTVLFLLLNLVIGTIAFTSSLANQKQNHENQKNSQNDPHKPPHIAKSPSLLHRLKSINFHTHLRSQEPLNPSTHHKPNPDSDTLFNTIDHTHHESSLTEESTQSQSHYFFQDNHQTLPQTQQAQYVFEETHEQNPQAHLDSDENEPESEVFHSAREEKPEGPDEQSMDGGHLTAGGHFSRTKSDTEPASGAIPTKLPARMRKSASLKSPFSHFEEEEIVETRRPETVREKGSAKVTDGDEEVDAKADDFINRFKEQLKLQRLESIVRYKDMVGRVGK